MHRYVPIFLYSALYDLTFDTPCSDSSRKAPATAFPMASSDLLFQSIANVPKGIVGGDWTQGDLAPYEHGVGVIDNEACSICTDPKPKASALRGRFATFFEASRFF